ncbi:methyltransferase [Alginatibacterium sediminis]|uniref:Methyltransferase n=1 Tax=Alginatibacterium sediminis TaxID=2164068 RepID=A0A420E8Y3_9ALTE|nr:methyltransferase [Alginatibacterium sediminis]RKF15929.1 methyltransferase [Alginatibacterium sediminis]
MSNHLVKLFVELDTALADSQAFWNIQAFEYQHLPKQWPKPLRDWLSQQGESDLDCLESKTQNQKVRHLESLVGGLNFPRVEFPKIANAEIDLPFWITNGIKGRKLDQLQQFCCAIPRTELPRLEWCAGKGHLGRIAYHINPQPTQSLEWDDQLCLEGAQLAKQHNMDIQFQNCDVLNSEVQLTCSQQHVLALHACGDLHTHLLKQACATQTQVLSISPCCYHRIQASDYRPLSQLAAKSQLRLSRKSLKLAVQQSVTSGKRTQRLRDVELLWRLSADELQRKYSLEKNYRPLASFPKQWLSQEQGFKKFIQWAAAHYRIELPSDINFSELEMTVKLRRINLRRIELIQHIFQRELETWLILDRAIYLTEHNYDVVVQHFCDFEISPRNFLINAKHISYKQGPKHEF